MRDFILIAGPCAVESLDEIVGIGKSVRGSGATHLRYMLYKPRTRSDAFQGVGDVGLEWAEEVKERTGLALVTEVLDPRDVEKVSNYADVIQIGSRNASNAALIREVGNVSSEKNMKVILKRGMYHTLSEWEGSFGYLGMEKSNVWMCERGIRTSTSLDHSRNVLDIGAICVLKDKGYTVIVDPSHGTGKRELVERVAIAALSGGIDGLEVEVHFDPIHAFSDPDQAIIPSEFDHLVRNIEKIREIYLS